MGGGVEPPKPPSGYATVLQRFLAFIIICRLGLRLNFNILKTPSRGSQWNDVNVIR